MVVFDRNLLVIDEVRSLQVGTVREQARFLNMLRFLGNELRIPLVCVGTQAARNALRGDDQLVRRFEAFALPPWRSDDDFAALIGSLIRSLPLRRESIFGDRARQRLIEATGVPWISAPSIRSSPLTIAATARRVTTGENQGGDPSGRPGAQAFVALGRGATGSRRVNASSVKPALRSAPKPPV